LRSRAWAKLAHFGPELRKLTPEYRDLMTEHNDLRVLRRLAAAQQDQPAENPNHDQIQQTDRHEPRSCRNPPTLPNRSSQAMRRVLERYRRVVFAGQTAGDLLTADPELDEVDRIGWGVYSRATSGPAPASQRASKASQPNTRSAQVWQAPARDLTNRPPIRRSPWPTRGVR
jgi:hypothetical protein